MLEQWIESIQTNGPQVWVGLWVSVLAVGFVLCSGNLRRQILIGTAIFLWGTSYTFYQEFYVSPIARFAWFPYWVLLETLLFLSTAFSREVSEYFSKKFNITMSNVSPAELRQESIICIICLLSIFTNVAQLGSALAGFGRETAVYYDNFNRLFMSVLVFLLVTPGTFRTKIFRDKVS